MAVISGLIVKSALVALCAAQLSSGLDDLQRSTVTDQTCETTWPTYLIESGETVWTIDAYTRLHVLPCSHRDPFNPTYKIYAEFAESPPLYRALRLPLFDLDGRMVARDELYDSSWDSARREVTSTYKIRGRPDCGSRMVYGWDDRKLSFSLTRAYLKPTCDGQLAPWPQIWPAH